VEPDTPVLILSSALPPPKNSALVDGSTNSVVLTDGTSTDLWSLTRACSQTGVGDGRRVRSLWVLAWCWLSYSFSPAEGWVAGANASSTRRLVSVSQVALDSRSCVLIPATPVQ